MSPEKQQIAIGRDCCGKEIIPLLGKKLEVRTNRHTTTDGYLWGWIEGTTANTVWGDDHKFNQAAAVTLVRDYNAESSAKHEANTAKSASSTSPATEESSATSCGQNPLHPRENCSWWQIGRCPTDCVHSATRLDL